MFIAVITINLIIVNQLLAEKIEFSKCESPVPFGKLTYIVGEGLNMDSDLRIIRLEDGTISFPSKVGYKNIFKNEGDQVKIVQQHENIFTIQLPQLKYGVGVIY